MAEKKYPILYYDIKDPDFDTEALLKLSDYLTELSFQTDIRFVVLPKNITAEYVTKETILRELDNIRKDVEEW